MPAPGTYRFPGNVKRFYPLGKPSDDEGCSVTDILKVNMQTFHLAAATMLEMLM